VCVDVGAVFRGGAVAGQAVDAGDDRRRRARAADHTPTAEALAQELANEVAVAVVDGDAGVRIGDGGNIRDRPLRATGVVRPGGLRLVCRAAAARSTPGGLGPAARVGGVAEGRAADRGHVPRGGRVLDAVAAVAGGHRDRNARVVEVG